MAKRFVAGWYNPALNSVTPIDPIPIEKQTPFPTTTPYLPKYPPVPPAPMYHVLAPQQNPRPPSYQILVPQPLPPSSQAWTAAATSDEANAAATTAASEVVRSRVKKVKASNIPGAFSESTIKKFTFGLCFLAACSIGFSACDLALSSQTYFTKTATWQGCAVNASSISGIAPNTQVTAGFFWLFASTGVWAGVLVFLIGLYASYMDTLSTAMLIYLRYAAILTFAFLGPAQVVFGIMDFVGSFACLGGQAADDASRIKLAMPILVAISGLAQIVVGYYLSNQIRLRGDGTGGGGGVGQSNPQFSNNDEGTPVAGSKPPTPAPVQMVPNYIPPQYAPARSAPAGNFIGFNQTPFRNF